MELKDMIYRRKSTRSYTGKPVDEVTLQKIRVFAAHAKPLYEQLKVRSEIVNADSVRCILPWTTPQMVAVFSEEKDGAMENVGFIYQQLDLYMQSLGLGVCWLGMGRLASGKEAVLKGEDDLKFVMLLAFGYPKGEAQRHDVSEFKRKSLAEISDKPDAALEPARLAPSSVNSQPWYFTHEGDTVHLYCVQQGILMKKQPSRLNRMDVGIALAHLYVVDQNRFQFFKVDAPAPVKGYSYIGSFKI